MFNVSRLSLTRPLQVFRRSSLCRSSTSSGAVNSADFCVNLVKDSDYDNYLCGLLLPRSARRSYFAIRAFNCEIARIKDQVHGNAMTGAIRFQWWHDQIDMIYAGIIDSQGQGHTAEQPLIKELSLAVQERNLTKRLFSRIIEARQRDLNVTRPETLSDLEDYGETAHSSLLYLLLEVLGVDSTQADYAASHVGVGTALATLLRGTAFHATKGHIYIPRETAAFFNLTERIIIKGPQSEADAKALSDAVFDIASQAHAHLDRARGLLAGKPLMDQPRHDHDAPQHSHNTGNAGKETRGGSITEKGKYREKIEVPPNSIYAMLPAVRARMVLDDLQKANWNPFDPKIISPQSALSHQIKLVKAVWRKNLE